MIKKCIVYTLAIVAIVICGVGGYYHSRQHDLLFMSLPLPQDHEFDFDHPFEEHYFKIDEKATLHALLFKAPDSKGVIAYYHGQGENIQTKSGKITRTFIPRGYDVMIMDYRGFGKSTGNLCEKTFLEDALTPYDFLMERYGEKNIVVYGCSLGTSVAAFVASKKEPKMLILESPYYNMIDLACYTKPYLPRFLVEMILQYPLRTDQFIKEVTSDTHIFHSTHDRIVPYDSSLRLLEECDAELTTLEGGNHYNVLKHPTFNEKLDELLSAM
ncbi:MAG: alpha/beta hydrolase [Simkaniaceae bacterium]|nr:alpha/beta hydrolase [Simkaniaceae bacterium]